MLNYYKSLEGVLTDEQRKALDATKGVPYGSLTVGQREQIVTILDEARVKCKL